MQSYEFNVEYASSFPELQSTLNQYVSSTSDPSNVPASTMNNVRALVLQDQYDWGSAAWFLVTKCSEGIRQGLQTGGQSGWENYFNDRYTTIPPTHDRMAATSMVASWKWSGKPSSYPATNAKILATLLEVFSTTYSSSVQDSLYRMGEAALAAVPEISEISMACPNIHYILMNLSAFGMDNHNDVFLPTDEPHGQIECTVGRG